MTTALLETQTEEDVVTEPVYVFTMNDRCDADRGVALGNGKGVGIAEQAYHRATKGDAELFFCNHHMGLHEDALLTSGWKIESDLSAIESMSVRHKVYSEVDG